MTTRPRQPTLSIRLFGPPTVLVTGRPIVVDTRKAVAILVLLAADARPYARDELAAILWPDSDDTAARGALRRTLSTLRGAIPDGPLSIDRTRVELDRRQVRVDLAEVEAATRSDDRATLAGAADLARGGFLAGFTLRDSPEFDDWRATRTVAVERSVLTVLDRLAALAEADGDLPDAIDAAARRLELDPLDESGHVHLMELLDVAGDRSGAIRQYRTCVAILERELGVTPLASTTERYEAIRSREAGGSPVADRASPTTGALATATSGPPGPVTGMFPLVGRDDDLAAAAAIIHAARDGGGRIIALVGEAGIGKTRLAAAIADAVRSVGGVVLAATAYPAERSIAYGPVVDLLRSALRLSDGPDRLDGCDPLVRHELARLLPALDPTAAAIAPSEGPGAHARLVSAIADGLTALVAGPAPGMIWLDDIQWLDGSTREALGSMATRLGGRPLVLMLTWRAGDLDEDGSVFVERLMGDPTTTVMALERLGAADVGTLVRFAGWSLDADPGLADRLFEASEGLPLYVTEALRVGDGALSPTLPAGVSVVLRGRLASVSEMTGQVLAAASVIGRSFAPGTLRHASGRTDDETVDAIDEALRRGLIREAPTGYDFVHGALRDLTYDGISLARRRLLHRRAAEALRLDLAGSGRDDLGRLVQIADHERSAGREAEAAEAYRIAGERAADVYANQDAIDLDAAALALGHPDAVGLHATIGRLRTRIGDYAGAIAALEAAAALATPSELPELEWALARAHLRRGDLAAAATHLAAAEADADDGLAARIWVDRSVIRRRAGDPAGAAAAARDALVLAERAGDPVAVGAAHRMLGFAALASSDPGTATAELQLALAASTADPDPSARVAAMTGLAMAAGAAGDVSTAMEHGDVALATCRRIGDRHLEAAVENHLADLLHAAGRDDDAMAHLRRAVEAFAEVGGDPADPDPGIWMLSAS